MPEAVRFAFAIHLHQPVGNFDSVFEQHLQEVYRPLLETLEREELLPVILHLSGPLLTWLEEHPAGHPLLDRIGRLAAAGSLELLASGFDEPILAALSRDDRHEQIVTMRDALRRRFGVEAQGLWLTERVWEPDLAADLARADVRYALVDDRHFLVAGHERESLHAPWRTASDDRDIALFPIDERLRYLVPFQPPHAFREYIHACRDAGYPLAVLGDDGEKFGGWPGTYEWVYTKGWFARFGETVRQLRAEGALQLTTLTAALEEVPSGGLTYLPSASYREMEGWALPAPAAHRLAALEQTLGPERMAGPDGVLVRGSHWKSFLVQYPESNAMHRKTAALSRRCRAAGDPPAIRRAIGRGQCNDAYWHGVFGGLYLPHLRDGVWRNLIAAEAMLRRNERLTGVQEDVDGDGALEVAITEAACSLVVAPARGGTIEEFCLAATGSNHADVLTRRREAYHVLPDEWGQSDQTAGETTEGAASIHDLEAARRLTELPPIDRERRGILVDRLLSRETSVDDFLAGRETPLVSWRRTPAASVTIAGGSDAVTVTLAWADLQKQIRVASGGRIEVAWTWTARDAGAWFSTECSLRPVAPLVLEAEHAERWEYPVETVSQSERGFDRTTQGTAIVFRWPATLGAARLIIRPEQSSTSETR